MQKQIIEELNRLYDIEKKYNAILSTIGSTITKTADNVYVSYQERSYEDLCKQFDWVSNVYNEEWDKETGTDGDKEFIVHHFNKDISSEDAIKYAEDNDLRPATRLEAIAFAQQYPEEQRKYYIVALGSSVLWLGHRFVTVLRGGSDGRSLGLDDFAGDWGAGYRFLFVRK